MMQEHIWMAKEAVVLTSATLRTNGTFEFVRDRLGAEEVTEVVLDTPFDYKSNSLLFVPTDIPEPAEADLYQSAVERALTDLCIASQGRALVLFTSYDQLRRTASAISGPLGQVGITIYDQTDGGSRSQLLEGFVSSEQAVLMGTRSFWEGIDIPGDDLSVVVIVRLPFSVPTDPLFAARSEQYGNPFSEYALPDAILRFRQGFGRLIRRADDRGVVVILDKRVITKSYGPQILNSLPECNFQRGRLSDLGPLVRDWLDGSTYST
jgi:DNA polymerase-3 subunit epsilon/ATP-dependent DNA helicase DinG